MPDDKFPRPFRMHSRGFGPSVFESGSYFGPAEPVSVPDREALPAGCDIEKLSVNTW
jgi:hypothetical protein